jgi:hypothetical protein
MDYHVDTGISLNGILDHSSLVPGIPTSQYADLHAHAIPGVGALPTVQISILDDNEAIFLSSI